jgi:hypothetical protein
MTIDIQEQLTPQEAHWLKLLEESKKSATTQKAFCAKNGIDYTEFKRQRTAIYIKMGKFDHLRKRRRVATQKQVDFIPIKVKNSASEVKTESSAIKIEIDNISIHVSPGFDPATLKTIIETVR